MKVVSVIRFYHDKGAYRRETKSLQFCCEDVKKAWGRAIGFGDFDFERNMDNHVNLYVLVVRTPEGASDEGAMAGEGQQLGAWADYWTDAQVEVKPIGMTTCGSYPIGFCPFCGEPIEIETAPREAVHADGRVSVSKLKA